ncbi:ion transporter [Methanoplanus limicola]|uniref:Ion transport protein n=1 Tax=Methanoplanus limicola DSM 2279 TaxID=937775 RepID=H1Z2W4_9EURY|nr:ion transporter [Methanoplanus limicola]EHQ34703.1 Ion transport protein [Methanoplanus limicola DSM 2279]
MREPSRLERAKARIQALMEKPAPGDKIARFTHVFLALVIITNTIAVVIFTIPSVEVSFSSGLNLIITFCLLVFTIEYILRIWSCTSAPTITGRFSERLRYATGFYQIIDLISIIPLIFPVFFPTDFALLRGFRLISIFKLGRYARNSTSLALLKRVVIKKREIFTIMIFFLVFVILFSSTIMYLVENHAQPDKFSSIPAAIWWAMMTVTTVGYGDIYPITPLGKTIGSFITLAGVLLLALPSAILATGFIEERQKNNGDRPDNSEDNLEKSGQMMDLLERAAGLREKGIITDEEYSEIKAGIISEKL